MRIQSIKIKISLKLNSQAYSPASSVALSSALSQVSQVAFLQVEQASSEFCSVVVVSSSLATTGAVKRAAKRKAKEKCLSFIKNSLYNTIKLLKTFVSVEESGKKAMDL